jgi:NTP pyrophosphatase (non-canonical NTP hydrolase)
MPVKGLPLRGNDLFASILETLHIVLEIYQEGQNMPDLTIRECQERVDEWIRTLGVRYFSELTNLAQLVEEVGEVARIMARTYGDQSWKPTDQPDALADELADVLFVLMCIANQTGIDVTSAFHANLDKKTRRDSDRHRSNPRLST